MRVECKDKLRPTSPLPRDARRAPVPLGPRVRARSLRSGYIELPEQRQ